MTSKKKKSKADIEKELGLTEENENNDSLWERFTTVTAIEAEKVLFTNEYWEDVPIPEKRTWANIRGKVRDKLFQGVKNALEHEEYSNGRPLKVTRTAFEWKMKQAITYRLSERHVRPGANPPDPSNSRASEYYDPVLEAAREADSGGQM